MENLTPLSEDQIAVINALGFIFASFNPGIYKIWRKDEKLKLNYITKLKTLRVDLDKELPEILPRDKVEILKKDLDDYFEVLDLTPKTEKVIRLCEENIFLPRQARKIFDTANNILQNCFS